MNENKALQFSNKRLLSLDLGQKKTGVALFHVGIDPMIQCLPVIINKSEQELLETLLQITRDEVIDILIIGVSTLTDGTVTNKTKEQINLAKKIEQFCDLQVFLQDETFSTLEAKERVQSKHKNKKSKGNKKGQNDYIDSVSAKIILEDFLEMYD